MWSLFVYFLIFLIPGFVSVLVYNLIAFHKIEGCKTVTTALIFDLFITGINLAGLRFLKGIDTFCSLQTYFNCLSFTSKYILLSLFVGSLLAIIAGFISYLFCLRKRWKHCDKDEN